MAGDALPFHRVWPALQVMALPARRLVCLPIAKCACTSLKVMMVELSDLPPARKAAIARDVHRVLDDEATGLQLKDFPEDRARALVADPGALRFAVVRDPAERLVSAYLEKFVRRRERKRIATAPAIAAIRGVAEPTDADFARGIRFSEFLDYVTATPPMELDPHWRPQIESFRHLACTHVYPMEHLALLEADLAAHLGRRVALGRLNAHGAGARVVVEGAGRLWPSELPDPARIAPESFLDAGTRARIEGAYAADAALHGAALREARLRLDPRAAPRPWRKRLSLNGIRRAMGSRVRPR